MAGVCLGELRNDRPTKMKDHVINQAATILLKKPTVVPYRV